MAATPGISGARGLRRASAALFSLGFAVLAGAAVPPAFESDLGASMTGGCQMEGPGVNAPGGDSGAVNVSVLSRHALPFPGLYWDGGLSADSYFFTAGPAWPARLQDYAALLGVEYFQGAESVAGLTLQPGWYFESHPSAKAWDVPVDLTAGVPITGSLSGVLGGDSARFYHHPLPVAGLVWTVGPRVRLEMVYPEPALVLALKDGSELRLGGELIGAGFLSDPRPVRTAVEYESYRVGIEWSRTWKSGCKLALDAGVETERDFDFFEEGRRLHGSGAGYLEIKTLFSD